MKDSDAQFSMFEYLPGRCVDCIRFFRWHPGMKHNPNGWYRRDVGGCTRTNAKVMTYDTCDKFKKADVSYDEISDMRFIKYELTNENFNEPEIQARLDEIAEREMMLR